MYVEISRLSVLPCQAGQAAWSGSGIGPRRSAQRGNIPGCHTRVAALRALAPGERERLSRFLCAELERLKSTLERCELEVQKLHILAAAADEMLMEARAAFGLEKPKRLFEVMSDLETNILPLGDGTVGIADDQLEPAHLGKRLNHGLSESEPHPERRDVRAASGRRPE